MVDDMRVRHIRDSDWDGIVALEAGAYTDSSLSEGRAALESRAWASPATCFVLEGGLPEGERRIAGYVLALPYPMYQYPDLARSEDVIFRSRNLHLHDLVIAEEFRGRGLAKRLLRPLTESARSMSYERISLIAVEGNESFWSANGYHPHPHVTLPGTYGTDAVYMSRTLHGGRAEKSPFTDDPPPGSPSQDEVG
ncbi:GNAT family N-acetyltransferase [Streptomyces sp. NBC_01433]|uniref:GNAT family N-acetyltransferase n=1 Tax=Streptomyces sp. NBC_01433 TaxID=2903864 RepID=UPI002253B76D|nr:GNAT family N-acetyltransferase [Streptomyces sp. NBC_01433]MCX4677181.1 GNAT family N-acetyltransferase [Streptomyces sp. NBC_01433]